MTEGEGSESDPLRVLLVEDDPDHAELVRRGLEEYRSRLELTHIADGERALAYLKERAPRSTLGRPHLILLDLRLPRMDGLEVLRDIKAAPDLNDIPCVVLTTSRAEGDMLKAYRGDPAAMMAAWKERYAQPIARLAAMREELKRAGTLDLAVLSVLLRELRGLA